MGTTQQNEITTTAKQKRVLEYKDQKLLKNINVRRWYDNLARGSKVTAKVNLIKLRNFCAMHDMTPMQLAELGMKDLATVTDLLQDHVTLMEERKYAPGYIKGHITAAKSWLGHFDVIIKRKIKIANSEDTTTLAEERVPDATEMAEIHNRASIRTNAIISLIAKTGLRLETIGNDDGTDGLKMSDLPDIAIVAGVAKCLNSPPRIIVRKSLSKARHQYFTMLTTQGTKRLLAYLNDRLAGGEPLNADAPAIAPDAKRGNHNRKFLRTNLVSRLIREAFRPRFKWRPYVLRAYFDTQLLIAESRGKVAHDFRVFWMGHKGSMEARYTTNKGVLPESLLNEMREAFKRSEEFLDLEVNQEDPLLKRKEELKTAIEKATPEQMQEMLNMLGIGNIIFRK